jgi:hypothetical protein
MIDASEKYREMGYHNVDLCFMADTSTSHIIKIWGYPLEPTGIRNLLCLRLQPPSLIANVG